MKCKTTKFIHRFLYANIGRIAAGMSSLEETFRVRSKPDSDIAKPIQYGWERVLWSIDITGTALRWWSVIKSHLSIPILDHGITSRGLEVLLSASVTPTHTHTFPHPAPPSGVLLCCQITKWLFACYKQRKQILYRWYIYIHRYIFFHWEMSIGIHITLIHILKCDTHTHTPTHTYTNT